MIRRSDIKSNRRNEDTVPAEKDVGKKARVSLTILTLIVAIYAIAYRLIVFGKLEQTAALFIGLPTLIAFGLIITPPARTTPGLAMKVTAILLALSGIILAEGLICILIAAPIFLCVVGTISFLWQKLSGNETRRKVMILLPFALMSLEGIQDPVEFERQETIETTQSTSISAADFLNNLARPLDVTAELPFFLKAGFPRPISCEGEGLSLGDRRTIHFAGGEGKPGDLTLEVIFKSDQQVIFKCVDDSSHIAHWMNWKTVSMHWSHGRVTATIAYERLLDPAWYFRPIERYGVTCAGKHLLRVFTHARDK